ncbi:MAG: glycosyltransferase family 2 protein [Kofleriaceae bacterium]|nr:glycosyltransferase family 2 protein [Kofleriaceae bacterium]
MELTIVIPAYNEEMRIAPTLQAVDAFLRDQGLRYEIVVVDDGSSDGTVALVQAMMSEMPALRCLESERNRGKGHAVRVGMLSATGEVRLMCDADGSMPPSEMPKLLRPIFSGAADIAIGSRYAEGASSDVNQPAWRVAWSRLANRIIQRSLVAGISDTQCGFKAFSAKAAEAVFAQATIDGWSFDLEVLALAKRLGFHIEEHGVAWTDDDRSRVSPVRDFIAVVREFLIIRKNFKRGRYQLALNS